MRILFTYIGGLGHFYPLVPVARAAVAAGHEVAVAGSGRLVEQVEAAGFRCFATSATPATSSAVAPGSEPRDLTPLEPTDAHAAEVEFAENFAGKGARRHAVAVQEPLRDWRPDVVVRDEADFGSAVAAELVGVPVASVLVLAAGMLVRPDLVAGPLAELRAEHGLPPVPGLAMLTGDLVLAPFAPSFRSPDSPVRLPGATYWFRPHERLGSPRPSVAPGSSRPRVYVTLGTVFGSGSGDLFERLLAGLALVDADVLVTVGQRVDPADFGAQPDHVRIERFVPQEVTLAQTDLVVSHGGSGSLAATLAHGLPSVLLPLGADQPHNALRAEELGVASVLDAATASPELIRLAVDQALHDGATAAAARRLAAEVDGLPGVDGTVPLLEALAR